MIQKFSLALILASLLLASCAGPNTIRKTGLSYISIGDSMPKAGRGEMAGHTLRESTTTEGDYSWRVCTLKYPDGKVILESDFAQRVYVNRIRIETPALQVRGGLQVGQTLADLQRKTGKWRARPFPTYQLIEMTSPKYARLVFLLEQPGFDYGQAIETVQLSELSADAKLVGIVVL